MRRLPVRGVVDGGLPQDFEKAVRILLSEPARPLLGDIRNCLNLDSEYLFYNKLTVGAQINTLLKSNGIQWPSTVLDDFGFRALHVALKSSRIIKKETR